MSFLSKAKIPNRFTNNGWDIAGYMRRPERTNTTEELINSIKAYAADNPEIAEFVKHLGEIKPEYLGLAHDVIDLKCSELLNNNIDFVKIHENGKSIMGHILSMLPEVSKKNPGALDLAQAVINNSDSRNAKYFLTRLFSFDLPRMGGLSEHMKAAKEIVPAIAKDTLAGGSPYDYVKNNEFFTFIQNICSGDGKPENIKLIGKIFDIIKNTSNRVQHYCYIDDLKVADTAKVKQNLEILPQVLKNADEAGKPIDVVDFLEHNINLD